MNVLTNAPRATEAMRVPVGRGQWVTIRPIESGDWDDLLDFYRGLSSQARYTRFLGLGGAVSPKAAQQFAAADHASTEGLVAVLREPGPDDGAVVGHICLVPDGAGGEEIAVAVADGLRGRGIGTALMRAAIRWARRRGISRLSATMFPTNTPMRRLMLDAGVPVTSDRICEGIESIELQPEVDPCVS
jgi:GNAT superfamily N-acetyltransferase